MSAPRVVVVTATYRRPAGVRTLLESLQGEGVAGVVVVDNGGDFSVEAAAVPGGMGVTGATSMEVRVVRPGVNLGCGGGVARGLQEAFADPMVTHAWIFDDDAMAGRGALRELLAGMAGAGAVADVAVPLVTDREGRVGWFPGPLAQPAWDTIRRRPSDDYWFQGEDLEWTLRLSAQVRGVLVPTAECRHYPPGSAQPERARLKQAAMLQNNLFTATRLPHGRRALRHAPGNLWRFLRSEGWSGRAMMLAARAHWRGAVRGLPAGAKGGDGFRREWEGL
ncbi:MAG: glycosyltransferase [Verrucomicrobiota bacterium]